MKAAIIYILFLLKETFIVQMYLKLDTECQTTIKFGHPMSETTTNYIVYGQWKSKGKISQKKNLFCK